MRRKIRFFGYMNKGYDGQVVMTECSVRNGFPGFDIVGLPDTSILQSRERVRAALRNCGFKFPQSRVLINLSPASQSKSGALLDTPIALSILFASHGKDDSVCCPDEEEDLNVMVAGELSLEGKVLPSAEALGAIEAARKYNCQLCLVPFPVDVNENVIQITSLTQAFLFCGEYLNSKKDLKALVKKEQRSSMIFEDVIGLDHEKEILAIAAAGHHSTLLFGPPGVGKTMLSNRVHLLIPKPQPERLEEINRIYGCANLEMTSDTLSNGISRILSHDCSQTQFMGGLSAKSPGEGSLAHCGTLVLDEINKYTPKLLESVRDTYDKGYTQSSRSGELVTYPARFTMIANMNPCQCGNMGSENAICTCTAQKIQSHWNHIGRTLIERFDIRLPIREQKDMLSLIEDKPKPDSYYLNKTESSSERQRARYKNIEDVSFNGEVHFNTQALLLLRPEIRVFNKLSPLCAENSRSQIALITLARSIADYDDRPDVTEEDFAKAIELHKYGTGDYYWRTLI